MLRSVDFALVRDWEGNLVRRRSFAKLLHLFVPRYGVLNDFRRFLLHLQKLKRPFLDILRYICLHKVEFAIATVDTNLATTQFYPTTMCRVTAAGLTLRAAGQHSARVRYLRCVPRCTETFVA